MPNRKPFSHDEFPDLTKAISEVVNPSPRPLPSKKTDQPQKPKGRVVHMDGWRGKSDGKRRRIDGSVSEACWKGYTAKGTKRKGDRMVPDCVKEEEVVESHTRAQLEKLSITRLRELLKQYTGKPGSGRELADIRGLLRAKGAGSVLDEGFEADERKAARSARVRKWMGRLKKANAADLKDKPGAAGEAAHKRLHKTIAKVVGEEAVQEMAMTAARQKELSRKIKSQGKRVDREYAKDNTAQSPGFKREYGKSQALGKQYEREGKSKTVYGKGGKRVTRKTPVSRSKDARDVRGSGYEAWSDQ